jgi:hypothetical protein
MDEKVLADAIVDRITTSSYTTVPDCKDSLRRIFNSILEEDGDSDPLVTPFR